jgi:ribosomal protein S18 acetylase RimI-like enzyme
MQVVSPGFSISAATTDDLPCLARFVNEHSRRWTGRDAKTVEQLATMLSTPGFDLASSGRLVRDPSGALAGASFVFHRDPHVTVHAWGLVGEAHLGKGVGTCLHGWILDRSDRALERAPDGVRVVVRQIVFDGDETAGAFLKRAGYTLSRHYWRMRIEFDAPPEAPEWPPGLQLVPCDPERDLEDLIRTSWDAFQDHYGFVAGSIDDELERTRHRIDHDPNTDTSLWLLLRDGDEIAGFYTCLPAEPGDQTTGYIQALGVRPAWRRRGLGRMLLRSAFWELYRREKSAVSLHVDAQSLTGATQLYESAGMRVAELSHEYELELRPGTDLTSAQAQS